MRGSLSLIAAEIQCISVVRGGASPAVSSWAHSLGTQRDRVVISW